jgi:hypothetical protein
MGYEFIKGMVETLGWEWDHSFLLGNLTSLVRSYLRGDITRERFTAEWACYEIARGRFYVLLDSEDDTVLAMQKLATELGVTVGAHPRPPIRGRRPSEVSLPPARSTSEGGSRT